MTRWLRLRLWLGRHLLPLVATLFCLALAFLFVSPLILVWNQSLDWLPSELQRKWFDILENVHWRSIQAMICVWVFALGSSIASFLNVVAYRLPRGRSILGRSGCPRCCQQLSAWDNVPIFGWLRNGGRCRICRLPISARYLWVELILGSVFVAVFFADVGTVRTVQALQFFRPELAALAIGSLLKFFGHALLLSLLFAVALIQWEKAKIPSKLVTTGWVLSVSWLAAVRIGSSVGQPALLEPLSPAIPIEVVSAGWLLSTGASLMAAFVLGAILPLGLRHESPGRPAATNFRETAAFGWLGLFLSWPITLTTGVFSSFMILLTRGIGRRNNATFASVFCAATAAILLEDTWSPMWRLLSGRWITMVAAGGGTLVILVSLLIRRLIVETATLEAPPCSMDLDVQPTQMPQESSEAPLEN